MEPEKNNIPLSEIGAKNAKEPRTHHKRVLHDAKKSALKSTQLSPRAHDVHNSHKEDDHLAKNEHSQVDHEHDYGHRHSAHKPHEKKSQFDTYATVLIVLVALVMLFNQTQISAIAAGGSSSSSSQTFSGNILQAVKGSMSGVSGAKDLSSVDIDSLKSTAHTVAAVLDVEKIKTEQDAIDAIIPTGVPEYGKALGVSFDDPVGSLDILSQQAYPAMKQDIKQNYPEIWKRYLTLASKPVGISCEFCCGVGPIGINSKGDLNCGCAHAPALHGLTLWLMKNTDYTDAEVLREVMKWKAIFFPRDLVGIGLQVAGGDTTSLKDLPGMVGGC